MATYRLSRKRTERHGKREYNFDPDKWAAKKGIKKHVIGIDGEGITDPETNIHRYTLLAASTGDYIEDNDLKTITCLEFLLRLPSESLKVAFSFNYDVNMILRSMPLVKLQELHSKGSVSWRGYVIRFIPSKRFSVVDVWTKKTCVVWDVFGFFQCSFVRALKEWKIADDQEINEIQSMKEQRGSFTESQSKQILTYCLHECNLLVKLFSKLRYVCQHNGINLQSYSGAGSVAAAILSEHGITQYITSPPKEIFDLGLRAYFGGRFEISIIGHVPDLCYGYDIVSAYPSVIQNLPCLAHGFWRQLKQPPTDTEWGLVELEWEIPWSRNIRWGPFPYRRQNGSILYPFRGRGVYWLSEFRSAARLYPRNIRVLKTWGYYNTCDHRPFSFVPDLFERRRVLKSQGDFGQIVLKLGLNSLYGKTAQSIGHGIRKPPYQSFLWAGMITAGTRSKILDAILLDPHAIVSIATDGIISQRPLDSLTTGKNLGEWETGKEAISDVFLAQPGLYTFSDSGNPYYKTRGFGAKEFDFASLKQSFDEQGLMGSYSINVTRFRGLGLSLAEAEPLQRWCQWVEFEKKVYFLPSSRIPRDAIDAELNGYHWSAHEDRQPYYITVPMVNQNNEPSYPYRLKSEWIDLYTNGTPLNELQELMDQPEFLEQG